MKISEIPLTPVEARTVKPARDMGRAPGETRLVVDEEEEWASVTKYEVDHDILHLDINYMEKIQAQAVENQGRITTVRMNGGRTPTLISRTCGPTALAILEQQ